MIIPKKVKIFGFEFDVSFKEDLDKVSGIDGKIDFDTQTIIIEPDRPQRVLEAIFIHEVLHGCLSYAGFDTLSDNESFVEAVGNALHQALTTSEGDLING